MQKPKVTKEQLIQLIATGEADEYLATHSESAPVYAPGRKTPRYDVLLDAEASDELYRALGGKGSMQTASQDELLEQVNAMADHYDQNFNQNFNQNQNYFQTHWKGALIRC